MTWRVYRAGEAVSHLLSWRAHPEHGTAALCGALRGPGGWLGDRGPGQRSAAADMPLCTPCDRAACPGAYRMNRFPIISDH